MMVLDAGAFVAFERNDRLMWTRLKDALIAGEPPRTHAGVIGQVWRSGSGRQVQLASAMQTIDVQVLDEALGRTAGMLLMKSGLSDVVDAALVAMVHDGDQIYTSDQDDIAALVAAASKLVDVVAV